MSGRGRSRRAPSMHRALRAREPARAPGLPARDASGRADVDITRAHVEDMLDEALMQTFPASDPVTLKACGPGSIASATAGADPVPRGTGANDGRGDDGAQPAAHPAG